MSMIKIVSSSPHLRSKDTTTSIMLDVIIALFPALVASVFIFGYRSLLLTAVCAATCVLTEYLSRKAFKRSNTVGDLSAVVTGILLAFNLPPSFPLWMAAIGCVFAILVVKQFFGGIGQNFVNPALAGRIVLMMSFSTRMGQWTAPFSWKADQAMTTATPMASLSEIFKSGNVSQSMAESTSLPTLLEMFLGFRGGCLGEVCAVALLIGGLYLIIRRVISPVIPFTYIATVAVLMLIAGKGDWQFVMYQVLGGGLMLGAFFMAPDYTTSPISTKGKLIYAVGCGLITVAIRLFGSLPEGVSFSIIIMNILVPHIEKMTTPKPFGTEKVKKEAAK